MKIITKGTEKVYYQMCQHCRTELEYQFEDVKYTEAKKDSEGNFDLESMTRAEACELLGSVTGVIPPKSPIIKELKCPVCNQIITPLYHEERPMCRVSENARGGGMFANYAG